MNRKRRYVCVFLLLILIIMTGCGHKNDQREIEEIYNKVFEKYQEVKRLIYVVTIEIGEEITDENGQNYLRVEEAEYQDMESIQEALKSAFSAAYIETNLSWVLEGDYPLYKEIDGHLCIAEADAIGEALSEIITSILDRKEDTIKIEVAGERNPYELTLVQEEGEWVIDQIQEILK